MIRVIDHYLDWIAAVAIVVLYVLRDQGTLVLSAETIMQIWVVATLARGITEAGKRRSAKRRAPESPTVTVGTRPERPPSETDTLTPEDTPSA